MTLTFQFHADLEALLEAAVGTPLPLGLVYVAASVGHTRVHLLVLHGPLEEALAGLAGEKTVVVTGHLVAAHRTQLLDAFLRVGQICGRPRHARRHGMLRGRLVTTGCHVHPRHRGAPCREQIRSVQVTHHMLLLLGVGVVMVLVVVLLLLHATPHGVLSQRGRAIQWGRHRIVIVGTGTGSHCCYTTTAAIATVWAQTKWRHIERKKGRMGIHFQ